MQGHAEMRSLARLHTAVHYLHLKAIVFRLLIRERSAYQWPFLSVMNTSLSGNASGHLAIAARWCSRAALRGGMGAAHITQFCPRPALRPAIPSYPEMGSAVI